MNSRDGDRAEIERVHERYLEINGRLDFDELPKIWSSDPDYWWFNLSGHNYKGLDHWLDLWRYYQPRLETVSPWRSFDRVIGVRGDVGWLTCRRTCELKWVGEGDSPFREGQPLASRSTEIYVREPDDWKVVHVHYSPESDLPRPGGI